MGAETVGLIETAIKLLAAAFEAGAAYLTLKVVMRQERPGSSRRADGEATRSRGRLGRWGSRRRRFGRRA